MTSVAVTRTRQAPLAKLLVAEGGAVDVFLTAPAIGDEPRIPRPVGRLEPGAIFVDIDLPEELTGHTLRKAPLPGAQLREIDEPWTQEPALQEGLCRWFKDLVRSADCGLVPSLYRTAEGDTCELQDGEALSVTSGLLGARVDTGSVAFLGREDSVIEAAGAFVLQADTWIIARGSVRLTLASCADAAREVWFPQALESSQKAVLRAWRDGVLRQDEAIQARIAQRQQRSAAVLKQGVRHLAGTLHGDEQSRFQATGDDPLWAACQRVARHIGAEFPEPPRSLTALPIEQRLVAGIEAAKLRKRRIALRGEWWLSESGPMLAFVAEQQVPVALIPGRNGRYLAYFPGDSQGKPVDAALAGSLSGFAYGLFRGLPTRVLTWRDLMSVGMFGQRTWLGASLVLSGMLGMIGLLTPMAMGYLLDNVIPNAHRSQLAQMSAVLACSALVTLAFTLLRSEILLRIETRTDANLQAAIWDRVLKLPVAFFRDYAAGDLALRVNAVNEVQRSLSGHTLSGLLSAIFSVVNFGLLFHYSPALAWVGVLLAVVAVVFNVGAALLTLRFNRRLYDIRGKLSSEVLTFLSGIAKLRVSATEPRAFARWAQRFAEEKRADVSVRQIGNFTSAFMGTYSVLTSVILYYLVGGGTEAESEAILSTGQFVSFSGTLSGFMMNFIQFSNLLLGVLGIVPLLERARPILDAQPEVEERRQPPGVLNGGLRVSNVSFKYSEEGPLILDEISFEARPGEFIALVGPSGSGKSTVMRLLLGFEKPASGAIYFDDKDLVDLNPQAVRAQLGVVLQSGQLMSGDIFQNIVGAHALSLDDAWEAAKLCGLDADIAAMPMGMHTLINEGATTLSGGQRQRILIARAIVRRPRILLFDEATSALDNHTQAVVARSVERLKATRIVIAHRLSTVEGADRILVMDRGRIVQEGSFKSLIAVPGMFRDLATRQLV